MWTNPDTKIHQVVKYLLATSDDNSRTWSIHLRHLAKMYDLPDPLALLHQEPWKKEKWKEYVKTKIVTFHERHLRESAASNSKMAWFNVSVSGLTGRHHPVLNGSVTVQQVKKMRPVVKMLAGDYYSYSIKSDQVGGGDHCRICPDPGPSSTGEDITPREDIQHILTECVATANTRDRILRDLNTVLSQEDNEHLQMTNNMFQEMMEDKPTLTQFILDCSSLNLPNNVRINQNDKRLYNIIRVTRDLCYSIHNERIRKIRDQTK